MILADKIINERKKNGWSQEELAEKLNVSRQSVSKWEGGQSIPDLQKILKMSELFSVSTDYLLRDEMESTEYRNTDENTSEVMHRVSAEEANDFLMMTKKNAVRIGFATLLCILSPICLLMLGGALDSGLLAISNGAALGIGISVLLVIVAAAVAIFVYAGSKAEKYSYLEKKVFETEYGVLGIVKERKKQAESSHTLQLVVSISIMILGVVPLFLVPLFEESSIFGATMLCTLLAIESIGVFLLIKTAVVWSGFEMILQEGDYSIKNKKHPAESILSTAFWMIAVAAYLGWSFISNKWDITWVVWPVAGVLYPAFVAIIRLITKKSEE